MLISSLFILFCKTVADFHQLVSFLLKLAVYSRHTASFLDLTYFCRTQFLDSVTLYPGHGTKMRLLYFSWDVKEILGRFVFIHEL